MVLAFIRKNYFFSILSIYVILGLYILFIVYSDPFLSIELEEKEGQWYIEDPFYKEWAEENDLAVGDQVLSINNIDINNHSLVTLDSSIRAASNLIIQKPDDQIKEITIKLTDIPRQFYSLIVIPTCYFLLVLYLAIFLHFFKKKTKSLNLLTIFMLTISLAYISSGASGRLNLIGLIVNGSCMLLCLVVLIHFLKHYYTLLKIDWLFFNNVKLLYAIPILSVFIDTAIIFFPEFLPLRNLFVLTLFVLLLTIVFYLLTRGYIKYKTVQLKFLFFGIVLPFLPFMLLYVVPKILFNEEILSAEIAALFLLLIPFAFISTQLTEKLFAVEYYITRIRYYASFSLIFSLWLLAGLYFFTDYVISPLVMLNVLFYTFISLVTLFYIKERIDYRQRKILFSTKGDYIHQLYATIDKIGKAMKTNDLLHLFTKEVAGQIGADYNYVITYDSTNNQFLPDADSAYLFHENIDKVIFDKLQLGDIWKINNLYIAFIHQDIHYKKILVLGHHKNKLFKDEDLLWLELLLLYLNNFIENTKMIEELIDELKQMKQAGEDKLPWLNKLLWLRFEEEKYQLAQELHDTNLQEQLHIAREVDLLIHSEVAANFRFQLEKVHEQMVTNIHDLRAYCENLKPPLLDTLGLSASLEKLLQKVALRADFKLSYSIDRLYLKDEQLNLVIYRLLQELLNNALKHSQATSVKVLLNEITDGFEIIYVDNGVGCDLTDVMQSDSMGIKGMQERVKTFNGQLDINSALQKGMSIRIIIKEGREKLDYNAHS